MPICQAPIQQGKRKGEVCGKNTEDAYCGKHRRQVILDKAKIENIRYCDVARGCYTVLEAHQVKCTICLHKIRINDRKRHNKKRQDPNNDAGMKTDIQHEYTSVNEMIVPIQEDIQIVLEKKKNIIPKQWKARQIHEVIQENNEELYKDYCEEHNDIVENPAWPPLWSTFVSSIKGKAFEQTEEPIKTFIDTLRTIRHNQLCYDKNSSIVDKEDRQQWPTGTVVRAFLSGKLDRFKAFTETNTDEKADDPKWIKRWLSFVQKLEENRDDEEQMKKLCSKFMTAQRVKRYREGKK